MEVQVGECGAGAPPANRVQQEGHKRSRDSARGIPSGKPSANLPS
jgi:hypothetical protein